MKQRTYKIVLFLTLAAGIASVLLNGLFPFSWFSYFSEMYPFFFGVSLMSGLFLLVLRLPVKSLAGVTVYWMAVSGIIGGGLILCFLGLFVNPINWKNYRDYTLFDYVWSPTSNAIIVLATVILAVLMIKELRRKLRTRGSLKDESEGESALDK